jgi:hypothetical protein
LYLANVSQARRNWQMALYAVHLATGNNSICRSIKASTILAYLRDVARFLGRFSDIDARFRTSTDTTLAPCIKAVLDEVTRWETVPDRREPFTIEMWKYLALLGPESQPDGIIDAITDWSGCGLYGGFRNAEWAQDDSHADIDHPQLDIHGEAKAFRLDDILWQTPTKVRLPLSSVLADVRLAVLLLRSRLRRMGTKGLLASSLAMILSRICVLSVSFFALPDAFCAWWAKTIPSPSVFAAILPV